MFTFIESVECALDRGMVFTRPEYADIYGIERAKKAPQAHCASCDGLIFESDEGDHTYCEWCERINPSPRIPQPK